MVEVTPAPALVPIPAGVPVSVGVPSKNSSLNEVKELAAGIFGGIAQVFAGQPFDTVKVRMQCGGSGSQSLTSTLYNLLSNEGPFALYKGTLSPLVGVSACVAAHFVAFEATKRFFQGKDVSRPLTGFENLVCGAVSGISSIPIVTPVEFVCIKLQMQTSTYAELRKGAGGAFSGPTDLIRRTCSEYGPSALFRGFNVTTVRDTIGMALYFYFYENLIAREIARNSIPDRTHIAPWKLASYGALAGLSYWVGTYPIDVIKTRFQTDHLDPAKSSYSSSFQCFRSSLRSGGLPSLFKGFFVCCLRAAPANAACFLAYEKAIHLLGVSH